MGSTVFSGGQVFDGTGSKIRSADVLVEDGVVRQIGEGIDGDVTVDVAGKVLIPGLFDCHAHIAWPNGFLDPMALLSVHRDELVLRFPATARTYLNMGITTVRDAGFASLGAKTAIEKGVVDGPRMQISVTPLSSTGGHFDGYMPFGGSADQDGAHHEPQGFGRGTRRPRRLTVRPGPGRQRSRRTVTRRGPGRSAQR